MPINPNKLPEKMRFCLLNEKGNPLRGIPLRVILEVERNVQGKNEKYSVSLGLLASDHVGYLAFDLRKKIKEIADNGMEVSAIGAEAFISPVTDRPRSIDITHHFNNLFPPDIVPLALAGGGPDAIAPDRGLSSIQNPDKGDWLLSPGSFGTNGVPVLGEDGCELLLPSHSAERIIRFHQLTRGQGAKPILTTKHLRLIIHLNPLIKKGIPNRRPAGQDRSFADSASYIIMKWLGCH